MGPELIGAYAILIDLFYARGGLSRRDDRHLGGVLGCSTRKATSLTDALIGRGKVIVRDDYLTNTVAEKEARTSRDVRGAQSAGGREGAKKRWGGKETKDLPIGRPIDDPFTEKSRVDKKETPKPPKGGNNIDSEEFKEWYELYPRKVAKGTARRAFIKARKKAEQADLIAAVMVYVAKAAGKDREFIAHPATWLNGERWLDSDVASGASSQASIGKRIEVAKDWLSRNDSIPTWMDSTEVAEALINEGHDYDKLRCAGFSLPPRGNVVDISEALSAAGGICVDKIL